jgi:hypothetical protein
MPSPLLVAAAVSSALTAGVLPSLLRSLRPSLQERLSFSDTQVHRLGRWFSLCAIPLFPLAGWLVDRWGLDEVMFAGSLAVALSISWIALSLNYASVLWGILGLAAGGACLFNATIVLMPAAFTWPRPDARASALGVGFVLLGASWLLTPVALPFLLRRLGHKRVLLTLGFLTLLPGLFTMLSRSEYPVAAAIEPVAASLEDPRLWLLAAMAFIYFLTERTLSVWPRPYLAEIGYNERTTARLLAGFWIAYLSWRLFWCWLSGPGFEAWMVFVLLVTGAMILGNLVGAYAPSSGYIGFWLVGACLGPLLPLILAMVLDVGGSHGFPGLAVGTVLALYPFNNLLIHPVVVAYAHSHTARASMRIPMMLALVMAAPTLFLALIRHNMPR